MSFEISGLGFSYGDHAVLEGVDLRVADGELACVLGPNGVGKTTLFRCILGLERPRAGTILVNGIRSTSSALPSVPVRCPSSRRATHRSLTTRCLTWCS